MSTELSKDLDHYELIVDEGRAIFVRVGEALQAIRDQKLYSDKYTTFEEYAERRFGFTKRRANQLISASVTVSELKEQIVLGQPLPANEGQARAITASASTPEERAKVWKDSCKAADKLEDGTPQVSASLIKRVAVQTKKPVAAKPPVGCADISSESIAVSEPQARVIEAVVSPKPDSIDEAIGRLMKASTDVRQVIERRIELRDGFHTREETYRVLLVGMESQVVALHLAWLSTSAALTISDRPRPVETLKRS